MSCKKTIQTKNYRPKACNIYIIVIFSILYGGSVNINLNLIEHINNGTWLYYVIENKVVGK